MLKQLFQLDKLGTTVKRELTAGSTTFLAMSYIIFVNPEILSSTGMDKGALITATILAAALGTILVGLWANVPFAMAPGMGLNAFFTYPGFRFSISRHWSAYYENYSVIIKINF